MNGPGNNATDIRNPANHELKAGDVFVIPFGTGHQFIKIDDHITYLMVRVDPGARHSSTYVGQDRAVGFASA